MHRQFVMTLACLSLASASFARDTWLRLGQRELDPRGDRIEIKMQRNDLIEALVLGVDNAAVRIYGVKVQLGNGRVLDWPIRGELYPRQRTHVLELPGPFERRVTKVVVFYETGHRRFDKDSDRNRRWEQHREWDREWNRDRDREWDRNWDRSWDGDYGRHRPVLTVWGRD
jgi:hypothetical protein